MLSTLPVCTRHGIALVDRCGDCKRPLSWGRTQMLRCECGFDLRESTAVNASDSARRLALALGGAREVPHMPEGIDRLPLPMAANLILHLGPPLAWPRLSRPIRRLRRSDLDACLQVFEAVAQLLDSWPARFEAHLAAVMERRLHRGTRSLSGVFGEIIAAVSSQTDGPGLEALRTAFCGFIRLRWPYRLDRRTRWIKPAQGPSEALVPLAEAARSLGMRPPRVRALARRHCVDVTCLRKKGCRGRFFLDRRDLGLMELAAREEISVAGVATQLGMAPARVRQLIADGLVDAVTKGCGQPISLLRGAVDDLAERLQSNARRWPAGGAHMLRLADVWRYRLPMHRTAPFLTALLKGELAMSFDAAADKSLGEIQIRVTDLQEWLQRQPNEGQVSVSDAATALGMKQEVAYSLVRSGHLRANVGQGRCRGQALVDRAELEAFKARYVAASRLAREWRTSPRSAVERVIKKGVLPIAGPNVDGCRQYYFSRDTLRRRRIYAE